METYSIITINKGNEIHSEIEGIMTHDENAIYFTNQQGKVIAIFPKQLSIVKMLPSPYIYLSNSFVSAETQMAARILNEVLAEGKGSSDFRTPEFKQKAKEIAKSRAASRYGKYEAIIAEIDLL